MGLQGVVEYFKFLDMEDHVLGSFKQVARNIITCVKREPCMPAADHDLINNHAERKWSLPSALVYGCDSLRSTIPPKMLFKYLGLNFVSAEIQQDVPFHVLESLGVSKLSIEQLVDIAKAVLKDFHQGSTGETTSTKEVDRTAELDRRSGHCTKTSTSESGQCIETSMSEGGKITELHRWIGQWFVVLYKTLQDSCDYSDGTMSLVRSLKMFPLCDGSIVSLQGEVVFFPVDCNTKTRKGKYLCIHYTPLFRVCLTDTLECKLLLKVVQNLSSYILKKAKLLYTPLIQINKFRLVVCDVNVLYDDILRLRNE